MAERMKQALVSWGGWPGHDPERWGTIFAGWMREWGFGVDLTGDLDRFADADALARRFDLIVPLWTLGTLEQRQEDGLLDAVARGVGLGGFHGMCGAFISSLRYKWMTGGQLVAHPQDCDASYSVQIADRDHEITRGISDFRMERTEQYYMHVDPKIHVLATTRFDNGSVNPVAWTTNWDQGRVFYISIGHAPSDFDAHEPREMLRRGLHWAAR
jgi:uncharacterized protein